MMIPIRDLSFALLNSWGADTAYKGEWDENLPCYNQCAVTALVVDDYFPGTIICSELVGGGKHYWNYNSEYCVEIDLTFEQFIKTRKEFSGVEYYVLRETLRKNVGVRYNILKERVDKYLKERGLV